MTQQTERQLVQINIDSHANRNLLSAHQKENQLSPVSAVIELNFEEGQHRAADAILTERPPPEAEASGRGQLRDPIHHSQPTQEEEKSTKEQITKKRELKEQQAESRQEDQINLEHQLPKLEKCSNTHCHSCEALKRVKSRLDGRILCLCRACTSLYNSMKFCQVCQQIYSTNELDDGLEWVECEGDSCARWVQPLSIQNHTECERKRGRFDGRGRYLCSDCLKRNRRRRLHVFDNLQMGRPCERKLQEAQHHQHNLHLPSSKRVKIFEVRKDHFHYLESFLSTYSYRLAIGEDAVANDLCAIRRRHSDNIQLNNKRIEINDILVRKKKR